MATYQRTANRVREQLVGARHGGEGLGRDAAQTNPEALQEFVEPADRTEVGRTEQDDLAHARGAVVAHREVVAIQHVRGAVAQVVARGQPAHAVRDDIDLEIGVGVVAANAVDQFVEAPRGLYIVLAPVIHQDVVTSPAVGHRLTGHAFYIATRGFQCANDRAVKITPGGAVGDGMGLKLRGSGLQGVGIDRQCDVIVAVEQQRGDAARPDLRAGITVTQARTEYAVHEDDRGFHLTGFDGGVAR